jgi:hypothetical protein
MDRPFLVGGRRLLGLGFDVRRGRLGNDGSLKGFCGRGGGLVLGRVDLGAHQFGTRRCIGVRHQSAIRLTSAMGRQLSPLVLMVRIAGGAASLLHRVFDHGDHRMVRDAALSRTVVIQNVTEPNPALLH